MSHSAETDPEPDASPDESRATPRPHWVVLVPTLIAVIALGVAAWALFRPPHQDHSTPSAQQVADAKSQACTAYNTVRTAVALQTHGDPGADPATLQLVAANARLAMAVGSEHLVDNLNPAVPADLAASLRSLAADLQNLTINALAGTADGDATQVARLHDLETTSVKIVDLCK